MNRKDLLRELIDQYLTFSESDSRQDLATFSGWLYDRMQPEGERGTSAMTGNLSEAPPLSISIAEQWGRLSQFAAVWSKLAFQSLPIKGFSEYGLLKYIAELKNPTKSDLVERSMLEKSTCYEIIRRLQQMGLIAEERDRTDRRIRRVTLTAEGSKWVEEGDRQLGKIAQLLVGDLQRDTQYHLLEILSRLNDFHARLYQRDHELIREEYL